MASLKRSNAGDDRPEVPDVQPTQRKRVRVTEPKDASSTSDDEGNAPRPAAEITDSVSDDEDHRITQQYELEQSQAVQNKRLGENSPNENGILESVECINFMCHKHFSVELGPLINFIVGKNGSGKSAILTAITLCLGGKASVTNRGQSLKKFIKEGEDSAIIIVRIKNAGEGAYRQGDYGDVITVERHFSRNGSSGFKLKNSRGRIISTKKADLDDIIDYYVLQIDNPMNVLSQDLARQFLSASTPSEKYKFFVKGVQLEQLDQDYRLMEDSVNQNAVKLQAYEDELKATRDKHKEAVKLQKTLNKHMQLIEEMQETRRLMGWAIVENQEGVIDDADQKIKAISDKSLEIEREISILDQQLQRDEHKIESIEQARAEATAAVEAHAAYTDDLNQRVQEALTERQNAQTEVRSIRESIKSVEANIGKIEKSIADEQKRLEETDNGRSTLLQEELEAKKQEVEELQRPLHGAQSTMRKLREDADEATKAAEMRRQPVMIQQNEVEQAENRLNQLKRHKDHQKSGFSPNISTLLRAIDNDANSFSLRPVGPLGNHVRLKKPRWSSILEQTFGGALSSFVVTSKRDMNTLQRIMQRTQCDTSPLDTSAHEPDPDYDTILRVLDIDNELVKRQLVINNGIEQVLLIADLEEASRVMFDGPRPRNVKRCFAIDRHNPSRGYALTYNRTGGPGQSPIPAYRGQPRMKTDHESQISQTKRGIAIRIQQEMLSTLRNDLRKLEEERRAAVMHSKKCQEAVNRHQREMNELRIQMQRTEDGISELQDEIANDELRAGRLIQLKENLQDNLDESESHKRSLDDAVAALARHHGTYRSLKDEKVEKDQERTKLDHTQREFEAGISKIQNRRSQIIGKKNKLYEKIAQCNEEKSAAEQKLEKEKGFLEECVGKATALCPERIPVPEGATAYSLREKWMQLKNELEEAKRRMGLSPEEVSNRTLAAEKKLILVERQYRDFVSTHQKLTQALSERFNRWKMFRSFITARAKIQFTYLLSERGFRGRTIVDHSNKLLDIKVEPDITTEGGGREAKTLSGGEKSFSQICLLLSLWEAMGSPIRCLDEFDVYMDSVNRRLSIELLMMAARRSVGKQFVFITPGSRADIKTAPDVKVNEYAATFLSFL
ncbi:Structural maintenance of chromosomes protein 6 [Ascosphaera pollenicola]|nr:Structural maintenance of chromosomes protein 6 [Ascosphaera pollenicola]